MSCSCKNNQNNQNNQINQNNRLSNRLRLLTLNRPNLFSGTIILNGVVNKVRTSLTLSLNDDKTVSYIHQILGKNNQFIKPFEGDKGIINIKGFLAVNNDGITQKYNSSDQTLEITSNNDNSIVGFLSLTPNTNSNSVSDSVSVSANNQNGGNTATYTKENGGTVKFPSPAPRLNNPQNAFCFSTNNGICTQGLVNNSNITLEVTGLGCVITNFNFSSSWYSGGGWSGINVNNMQTENCPTITN